MMQPPGLVHEVHIQVSQTAVPAVATWGGTKSNSVHIDSHVKLFHFTAEINMFEAKF